MVSDEEIWLHHDIMCFVQPKYGAAGVVFDQEQGYLGVYRLGANMYNTFVLLCFCGEYN